MHLIHTRTHTLRTASEVRQWIPSIKAEMDHCLHHLSGVRNYSDSKIKEFQERLALLQREHKKWVRRVLELDPAAREGGFTPGDPHPYLSKRKRSQPPSHTTPQKGEAVEQEQQQHERTVVSSQKKARTNATAKTTTATARATSSMSSNSTGGGIATPLLELEEEKEERQKEEARRHLEASLALDDSQNQPLSFSNHQDKLATTAQQPAEAEEGEEEETGLSLLSAYDD
ncbi:Dynein intermediate chain 2, ciliary [Balamuthia mandrillaris]